MTKQRRNYRRLSLEEREEISRGLACGMTLGSIAKRLQRHRSTVYREVGVYDWRYRAGRAQRRALRNSRKRRKGKYKLDSNMRLWRQVQRLLLKRWSPEQIANHLRRVYPLETSMQISPETIYSYLYVYPKGRLRKEFLASLRRGHKRRHKRTHKNPEPCGKPKDMIFIDQRPKEVEDRTIPGHWEGDLIYGRSCQTMLGTLVERKTRFLMLVRLKTKSAQEVRKAFAGKINRLPRQLRKTLTYDQGAEMAEHKLFTQETQMKVYFAHAQSPWERGCNENTNGLVRQFFPKGTDFSKVTSAQIRRVEYLLNDRPRKTLGWDKPCEALAKVLH